MERRRPRSPAGPGSRWRRHRTGTWRSRSGCRAGATSNATFTYRVDTSAFTGGGHRLVDREGRERHPDGAGYPPPARVHRLPVLHRLRDDGPGGVPHLHDRQQQPHLGADVLRPALLRGQGRRRPDGLPGGTPDGNVPARTSTSSSGDVINGPLHSNDAILLCGGPTFNGKVTTSWQGAGSPIKRYRTQYRQRVRAGLRPSPTAATRSMRIHSRCLRATPRSR